MFRPLGISVTRRFAPKPFPTCRSNVSTLCSTKDMHHRTHLALFHLLMTIVTVEWFYLVFPLYYVMFYADLYHRSCLEGVNAMINKARLSDFDSYFAYYPIDMTETCTIAFTSNHWRLLSRLNDFTSYFTLYYVISKLDLCHQAWFKDVHALMNKVTVEWCLVVFHLISSRCGRDRHHRTHLDVFHPLMTIVLSEFTSYLAYITSYASRTCHDYRICLEGVHARMNKVTVEWFCFVFHLVSNRYDRTHLDNFHILITIVTVEGFYHMYTIS